ncbi:hypothetical protein PYJP_15210 [Pyrofollis japonicus]|uniref:tRNA-wybutosine modification methyltransferase TYW3 n=1 Tax=Pyrofollis japonicus TaxID=3060460 RepID=UPI00295B3E09|nr:hypothetical protein [Pyrofollis japonicus]BEP18169.1 hypothetical protein PYJP_15210 [Pyrofollis japonicus]
MDRDKANKCTSIEWAELRDRLKSNLKNALSKNEVDQDIVDILMLLNSIDCIATSSSCSGRIVVIAAPSPGDKKKGGIQAKWHTTITVHDLIPVLDRLIQRDKYDFIWISAQPIILSIHTCSFSLASTIVRLVESIGFKYSGIKPHKNSYNILVLGTERIDIPIKIRENIFIKELNINNIAIITNILNTYLSLVKRKIQRLKRVLAASLHLLEEKCEEATLF